MSNIKNLKRSSYDKFYTKKTVVFSCLEAVETVLAIKDNDLVIEPSAGNGAFSVPLQTRYKYVVAFDIHPEHAAVIKYDYLTLDTSGIGEGYGKIHVIGNPPFGRQSSLTRKFIKKSCEYCDSIAFILPKSFKKDSFQKAFPPLFHLVYQIDLPESSFQVNSQDYDVPCIFQIWVKTGNPRSLKKKLVPTYYTFVKKSDSPHLSFRRVGVYAGRITQKIIDKSEQSHYFIRLKDHITTTSFIDKYQSVLFPCNNTVGPRSISKQELIYELNKLFN